MGRMVPLGPIQFSPAEVAMIIVVLIVVGLCVALPSTAVLAAVGARRAARHPGWNGLWYWFWGTALSLVIMGGLFDAGLRWWVVPISWMPNLLLAWLLNPRAARPGTELGWSERRRARGSDD